MDDKLAKWIEHWSHKCIKLFTLRWAFMSKNMVIEFLISNNNSLINDDDNNSLINDNSEYITIITPKVFYDSGNLVENIRTYECKFDST